MSRLYKACLFDLDGTLIRSTSHFDEVWVHWAGLHDIDPAPILATHHGRRMEDTIRVNGRVKVSQRAAQNVAILGLA